MVRLLSIEYFKLKNTRYFWVLGGLFLLFMFSLPIGVKLFLDYVTSQGANIGGLSANDLPLFDFVDIWQNLTWVFKKFSIFLGFIVVISVCNEYRNTTARQNIIDGMSRGEFLWSKILMIVVLSAVVALIAMIVGLVMGFAWSPVTEWSFVVKNIEFIFAYFVHLVTFLIFCLLVSMLIKKSGITIAILIFYIYMVEPIAVNIFLHGLEWEFASRLLPVAAAGNMIPLPFTKYILMETRDFIGLQDTVICAVYLLGFGYLAHRMITKRDL